MPLKNVCDALQVSGSILAAANSLGCSRAYIYKVLKANGLKLKDIKGQGE
jgi:biotin operon repressor